MAVLNRAYAVDKGKGFGALFFPTEYYAFYVNLNQYTSDISFNNLRLYIRNAGDDTNNSSVLVANAVLTKDIWVASYYSIGIIIPSFPILDIGFYQFIIADKNTAEIKLLSSYFQVEELSQARNVARVFFRNTINMYGFNYEANPNFFNVLTLPLIQIDFAIETDRKQYRNVTDRRLRNLKSYVDKTIKIESYFFDEEGHEAAAILFEHDTIFINRTKVVPKDLYTINGNIKSVLCKGTINLYVIPDIDNPLANYIKDLDVYKDDIGNNKYL